jgi:hypothetical protein
MQVVNLSCWKEIIPSLTLPRVFAKKIFQISRNLFFNLHSFPVGVLKTMTAIIIITTMKTSHRF